MRDLSHARLVGYDVGFRIDCSQNVLVSYAGNKVTFYHGQHYTYHFHEKNDVPVPGKLWQAIKRHVRILRAAKTGSALLVATNPAPQPSDKTLPTLQVVT